MTHQTCATCCFMAAEREPVIDASFNEHRTCTRIIHGNSWDAPDDADKQLALVTDGSGFAARLIVLPTFGCLLYEERKKP